MKKKNFKLLKIKKESISNLKDLTVKGGACDHGTVCGHCPGGNVDIPTIGWHDGPYCFSNTRPDAWCGGH